VVGRRGLRVLPDRVGSLSTGERRAGLDAASFDALLGDIEQRWGGDTRRLVALQIEYGPGR
jgi:hypothetical protein